MKTLSNSRFNNTIKINWVEVPLEFLRGAFGIVLSILISQACVAGREGNGGSGHKFHARDDVVLLDFYERDIRPYNLRITKEVFSSETKQTKLIPVKSNNPTEISQSKNELFKRLNLEFAKEYKKAWDIIEWRWWSGSEPLPYTYDYYEEHQKDSTSWLVQLAVRKYYKVSLHSDFVDMLDPYSNVALYMHETLSYMYHQVIDESC